MQFPQTINVLVDMRHKNQFGEAVVTQNDTGAEFLVSVVGDKGQSNLPPDAVYVLTSLHMRRQPSQKLGVLQPDGNVLFQLGSDELSDTGTVQAHVQAYHPQDGRVTSPRFIYHVAPDPLYGETIKPEDRTLIEVVLGEGPILLEETRLEIEKTIEERNRLTGAVGGALSSLADDKAQALVEMSQSKAAADESAQVAQEAATNADQERERLTQEVSGKITEVDNARTATVEATGEALGAADLAKQEAEAARLQKEEVQEVIGAGPVASVNGQTGIVSGLATQDSVDQIAGQLAEKAHQDSLNQTNAEIGGINQRIENLVIPISPENANLEVTDAHVSVPKGKTFNSLTERISESEREILSAKKDSTIYLMKNLLPNSDFSDGLKGWVAAGSTGTTTVSGGVLTHTASQPSTSSRLQVATVNPIPGHIYYARVEIMPSHHVNTGKFHFGDSQIGYYDLVADEWSTQTAILSPSVATVEFRIFASTYAEGDSVSYKKPLLIDLTELFGEGKEPNLEAMNGVFEKIPSGWFKNEKAMISAENFYDEFSQFKESVENELSKDQTETDLPSEPKDFYFVPENIPNVYDASSIVSFEKFDSVVAYQTAVSALAVEYPEYVTETFHGNDSSGTYPIYSYKLTPQQPEANNVTKKLPKLIVICGLHGSENTSVYSMYYLMKELCENWKNSPALEYLRWNTELVFMPNANPYGFENFQRVNANGVDINRNFPKNWRLGTIGDQTYGGPSAASEVETQYVISLLEEHKDAIYMADYHTNGSSGSDYGMLMWHSLLSLSYEIPELDQASRFFIGKMSRKFIKEYNQPDNVGDFGYVSYSNLNGCGKLFAQSIGMNASTLEAFMKFPTESENFTPTTNKACTEYIGNWLLTVSQFYKERYYQ